MESSRIRLRTTWERAGLIGELSGLAFMELSHISVEVELVLWIAVVQTHPMVESGREELEIYRKLPPQISVNTVS